MGAARGRGNGEMLQTAGLTGRELGDNSPSGARGEKACRLDDKRGGRGKLTDAMPNKALIAWGRNFVLA